MHQGAANRSNEVAQYGHMTGWRAAVRSVSLMADLSNLRRSGGKPTFADPCLRCASAAPFPENEGERPPPSDCHCFSPPVHYSPGTERAWRISGSGFSARQKDRTSTYVELRDWTGTAADRTGACLESPQKCHPSVIRILLDVRERRRVSPSICQRRAPRRRRMENQRQHDS